MCAYSADDPVLTTRLARLLRQSGEFEDAKRTLDGYYAHHPEQFERPGPDQAHAVLLRDLGDALCDSCTHGSNDAELERGRSLLEHSANALQLPGDRAEAYVALGDSFRPAPPSRWWYGAGVRGRPRRSHRGLGVSRGRDRRGHTRCGRDAATRDRPGHGAVSRQVDAGVNLPRSYAVMAELLVLAGDTEHGLDAFAKALRSTSARDVVDDALQRSTSSSPRRPRPLTSSGHEGCSSSVSPRVSDRRRAPRS